MQMKRGLHFMSWSRSNLLIWWRSYDTNTKLYRVRNSTNHTCQFSSSWIITVLNKDILRIYRERIILGFVLWHW